MADTLNQNSAVGYAILVDFVWGASGAHTAHYTSWDSPVTPPTTGAPTYTSQPRLEVEYAKQTGGSKDEPCAVTMPATTIPLNLLVRPFAFAPVKMTIWEYDPVANSAPIKMWSGLIGKTNLNPSGKPNCIRAEVSGLRALIQFPLGIDAKSQCPYIFGDPYTCGVNLAGIQQTAEITGISENVISAATLTFPSPAAPNFATWWTGGVVAFDGLSIGIVDASGGTGALQLLYRPPPEWLLASAVFTPGCAKDTLGCIGHDNLPKFGGVAILSPSWNPLIGAR